jgi:hypothetical protein
MPSTMSLPLCRIVFLISMFCAEKKPFWMPRSSGSAFAIGSVPSLIASAACRCPRVGDGAAVLPEPTSTVSATTTETPKSLVLRRAAMIPIIKVLSFCGR